MTAERVFKAEASTSACRESVYRLLSDAPSWKRWAGWAISYAEWEVEPGHDGTGAIRRLGRPPFIAREEIVAAEVPSRHSYRLLSGQPVRSYEAEVRISELSQAGGQDSPSGSLNVYARTRIEWTGTLVPRLPGTGWLMQRLFHRMIAGFARRLARAAEVAEREAR